MTDVNKPELSDWASHKVVLSCVEWIRFIVIVVVVVEILSLVIVSSVNMNGGAYSVETTVWLSCLIAFVISTILGVWRHSITKKRMQRENLIDWQRSRRVREMLAPFQRTLSTDYSVVEPTLPNAWRPFRVEHFVSESVRGELSGRIGMDGLFGGSFRSAISGTSTPNLLDTSTMLFLQNDQCDTLRVLVPTPKATRALLAATIEGILGGVERSTYTHDAINSATFDDGFLCTPISHPKVIDALDADCGKAIADRKAVSVIGTEIQPGVAVATALEVEGRRSVFFPSGFFRQLTEGASSALHMDVAVPAVNAAV